MNNRDKAKFPFTTTLTTEVAVNVGPDDKPEYQRYKAKRIFHSAQPLTEEEKRLIQEDQAKIYWSDGLGKNYTFDRLIDKGHKIWITDEFYNNELTESEGFIQKEDK